MTYAPSGVGRAVVRISAPTVIGMAAEMGPDELTMRAVALQDPPVWRVLSKACEIRHIQLRFEIDPLSRQREWMALL